MILLISFKLTYIKVIYIIQPNRPEQHLSLLQASTTTKIPPDEISPLCVDYFTGGIFIINKGILYFLTPLNTFAIMQVALLQFLLQFLDQFKVISVFHLRESFDDSAHDADKCSATSDDVQKNRSYASHRRQSR